MAVTTGLAQRRKKRTRFEDMPAEFAELELGSLGQLGDTTAEFEGRSINIGNCVQGS